MIRKLFWGILSALTWLVCFIAGIFMFIIAFAIVAIIFTIIMLILGVL